MADVLFSQFQHGMFIVQIFVVLISLVIHEFAHAVAADALGDRTARLSGRLTLNPLAHLEIMGLIMILFASIGWARPVPFNARNFRNPRLGTMITAAAGPITNLILALVCLVILHFFPTLNRGNVGTVLGLAALINVALFIFNLIPLPPLDGSQILRHLLPYRQAVVYSKLDMYGPFILLLIFIVPFISRAIFMPIVHAVFSVIASWFGLYYYY